MSLDDGDSSSLYKSLNNLSIDSSVQCESFNSVDSGRDTFSGGEQLINSTDWLSKKKHVFILSESGKPVYSR